MRRRQFLASAALAAYPVLLGNRTVTAGDQPDSERTFATPADARKSPPEKLAYLVATYAGTGINKPDYLATIDVDPHSKTYSQVVHRLKMPNVGDELHHFGWNACASCHGTRARRYLIVPGLASGRLHVIDTATPREPKMHKVIEPKEVVAKTNLTVPHTVHCLADGRIMVSMIGNGAGEGPGGFLLLDDKFDIVGHWEAGREGMHFNYDFWYQPRHNVMVSSEWAAPSTTRPGFRLEDVKAGKYGHHLHFWDWKTRRIAQSIDLGEKGLIPLEVRFHHNPDSTHGFVGAALSSVIWHWYKAGNKWKAEDVIAVARLRGQGLGLPGAGPHHGLGAVAGRPLALLFRLAARRCPAVRRERPRQAETDGSIVAGWGAGKLPRHQRKEACRRPADAAVEPGW